MVEYAIHWFKRDLRLDDNTALYHALQSGYKVKCIFIFDEHILSKLPKGDKRVQFIYNRIIDLKETLQENNSDLWVYYGKPEKVWENLTQEKHLKMVFTNCDYEPYAIQRDSKVKNLLSKYRIEFKEYKDQVIFEKSEILTQAGNPYSVFTPYKKRWIEFLDESIQSLLVEKSIHIDKKKLLQGKDSQFPSLREMGFIEVSVPQLPLDLKGINIDKYEKLRDFPANNGTTHLSTALRFGTLSIRETVKFAYKHNKTFLSELIWREFFMQILYHYPEVQDHSYKKEYDYIHWRNNEKEFEIWCKGKTGFPIVDAGMRQLNETGFMHNRVRMITASFLVKDLLIDWRWGEAYYAEKLMDYELSSNNGNWQWCAGTGADSTPYFRIFNPETQQKKFDPELKYIKKWIPEYGTDAYPNKIINHKEARERCLVAYKAVKS